MNCKTINKTIKQMLALLLAVAMVATSFSVPVKAAEGEDPIDESIVVAEETVEEEAAVESDQSVENTEIPEEGEEIPALDVEAQGEPVDADMTTPAHSTSYAVVKPMSENVYNETSWRLQQDGALDAMTVGTKSYNITYGDTQETRNSGTVLLPTGTLKYLKWASYDPFGTGNQKEGWYFAVNIFPVDEYDEPLDMSGLNGDDVLLQVKNNAGAYITGGTWNSADKSSGSTKDCFGVIIWLGKENAAAKDSPVTPAWPRDITFKVDWDGDGEEYESTEYTFDFTNVTLENAGITTIGPITGADYTAWKAAEIKTGGYNENEDMPADADINVVWPADPAEYKQLTVNECNTRINAVSNTGTKPTIEEHGGGYVVQIPKIDGNNQVLKFVHKYCSYDEVGEYGHDSSYLALRITAPGGKLKGSEATAVTIWVRQGTSWVKATDCCDNKKGADSSKAAYVNLITNVKDAKVGTNLLTFVIDWDGDSKNDYYPTLYQIDLSNVDAETIEYGVDKSRVSGSTNSDYAYSANAATATLADLQSLFKVYTKAGNNETERSFTWVSGALPTTNENVLYAKITAPEEFPATLDGTSGTTVTAKFAYGVKTNGINWDNVTGGNEVTIKVKPAPDAANVKYYGLTAAVDSETLVISDKKQSDVVGSTVKRTTYKKDGKYEFVDIAGLSALSTIRKIKIDAEVQPEEFYALASLLYGNHATLTEIEIGEHAVINSSAWGTSGLAGKYTFTKNGENSNIYLGSGKTVVPAASVNTDTLFSLAKVTVNKGAKLHDGGLTLPASKLWDSELNNNTGGLKDTGRNFVTTPDLPNAKQLVLNKVVGVDTAETEETQDYTLTDLKEATDSITNATGAALTIPAPVADNMWVLLNTDGSEGNEITADSKGAYNVAAGATFKYVPVPFKVVATITGENQKLITTATSIAELQELIGTTDIVKYYSSSNYNTTVDNSGLTSLGYTVGSDEVQFVWNRDDLTNKNNDDLYFLLSIVDKDGKAVTHITADKEDTIYVAAQLKRYEGGGDVNLKGKVNPAEIKFTPNKSLRVAPKSATKVYNNSTDATALNNLVKGNLNITCAVTSSIAADDILLESSKGTFTDTKYTYEYSVYALDENGNKTGGAISNPYDTAVKYGKTYLVEVDVRRYEGGQTKITGKASTSFKINVLKEYAVIASDQTVCEGTPLTQIQTDLGTKILHDGEAKSLSKTYWSTDPKLTDDNVGTADYFVLVLDVPNLATTAGGADPIASTIKLYKASHTKGNPITSAEWQGTEDANLQDTATFNVTVIDAFRLSILDKQAAGSGSAEITVAKNTTSANFINKILKPVAYSYKEAAKAKDSLGNIDHYAETKMTPDVAFANGTAALNAAIGKELAEGKHRFIISSSTQITDALLAGTSDISTTITATDYVGNSSKQAVAGVSHSISLTIKISDAGGIASVALDPTLIETGITIPYSVGANVMQDAIDAKVSGKVTAKKSVLNGNPVAVTLITKKAFEAKKKNGLYPAGAYYVWSAEHDFTGTVTNTTVEDKNVAVYVTYYNIPSGGAETPKGEKVKAGDITLKVTPANGYFADVTGEGYEVSGSYSICKADGDSMYDEIIYTLKNIPVKGAWENTVPANRVITYTDVPANLKKEGQVVYALTDISIGGTSVVEDIKDNLNEAAGAASIAVSYKVASYVCEKDPSTKKLVAKEVVSYNKSTTFNVIKYMEPTYSVTLNVLTYDGDVKYTATITDVAKGTAVGDLFPSPASSLWGRNKPLTVDYSDEMQYTWRYEGTDNVWSLNSTPVNGNTTLYTYYIDTVDKAVSADNTYGVQKIDDFTYTGKEIKPIVSVYRNGDRITSNYSVVFTKNGKKTKVKDAGTYKAEVTVKEGKTKIALNAVEFKVNTASIKDDDINEVYLGRNAVGARTATANDKTGKVAFGLIKSFKVLNTTLKLGTDYNYIIKNASENTVFNAKTDKPKDKPLGKGVYTIEFTTLSKTGGNITGGESFDVNLIVNSKASLISNAKIKVTGDRSLVKGGTVPAFTLTLPDKTKMPIDPLNANTVSIPGKVYTFTVPETHDDDDDDQKLTVTYSNNEAVGTASITISVDQGGTAKYVGSKTFTFKVVAAKGKKLTKSMLLKNGELKKLSKQTVPYRAKGWTIEDVLMYMDEDLTAGGALDTIISNIVGAAYGSAYEIEYINNVNAGKAIARVKALPKSGYTGQFDLTFKIGKPNLLKEAVNEDDEGRFAYGDLAGMTLEKAIDADTGILVKGAGDKYVLTTAALSALVHDNVRDTDLVNKQEFMVSYSGNSVKSVAAKKTVKITIKGKGNYQGKITFQLAKAPVSE